MKIFLVEDDTAIVFGLRKFMELNGWEVIASLTYHDALLNFSHDIDLCIVDIELPDGNGLDFCRHIKSNSNIPVIFLTAKSHERTVIEAFDLGADDYITDNALSVIIRRLKEKCDNKLRIETVHGKGYIVIS